MRKLQQQLTEVCYQFGKDVGNLTQRVIQLENQTNTPNSAQHSETEWELENLRSQNEALQNSYDQLNSDYWQKQAKVNALTEEKDALQAEHIEAANLTEMADFTFRFSFYDPMHSMMPIGANLPEYCMGQPCLIIFRSQYSQWTANGDKIKVLQAIERIEAMHTDYKPDRSQLNLGLDYSKEVVAYIFLADSQQKSLQGVYR